MNTLDDENQGRRLAMRLYSVGSSGPVGVVCGSRAEAVPQAEPTSEEALAVAQQRMDSILSDDASTAENQGKDCLPARRIRGVDGQSNLGF